MKSNLNDIIKETYKAINFEVYQTLAPKMSCLSKKSGTILSKTVKNQ